MKKKKVGVVVSSVAAIAVCSSMIVGSTFALFTSEDAVNIAVTSGKVDVTATVGALTATNSLNALYEEKDAKKVEFENGGFVALNGGELVLENITPGDKLTFPVTITNNSTVKIQYRLNWEVEGRLANVLDANVTGEKFNSWAQWDIPATQNDKVKEVVVSVELPDYVGNNYQDETASIAFTVEAVQGNANVSDDIGVQLPAGVAEENFVAENAVALAGGAYYSTLKEAVASGAGEIYLAPNAELTEQFTHAHVSGDLTVYGNGATLTTATGEHDFEVDTYNSKGSATGENVGLSADTTLTVYNLNGVGVWGERKTGHTLTVNLINCENIERVYITGTAGITNYNITDCTADGSFGSVCKIYNNSTGTVKITGCTFTEVAEPVNLNNKSNATQNIFVTDCNFINCSTETTITTDREWAAPIRVVSAKSGVESNLHLDNVRFTYDEGKASVNGNVLTKELRENKKSEINGKVNVFWTVDNTQAQEALDAGIDNLTVTLKAGHYDKLYISPANATFEGKSWINAEGNDTKQPVFTKAVNGLTLIGQDGAVVDGFRLGKASYYWEQGEYFDTLNGVDAARELLESQYSDLAARQYIIEYSVKNLVIENIAFEDGIWLVNKGGLYYGGNTDVLSPVMENVTIRNCKTADSEAIHYSPETDIEKCEARLLTAVGVNGLVVENNTIENRYQGIYIANASDISISGNAIDTIFHNAIQISSASDIDILNNKIYNDNDRPIRFADNKITGNVNIKGNIMVDSGDPDDESLLKAGSGSETMDCQVTISGNYWNGHVEDLGSYIKFMGIIDDNPLAEID